MKREDGSIRKVIYWPEREPGEFAMARGGIPVLFPFAGRSTAGDRTLAWQDTDGTVRPMPMHGFARTERFELRWLDATGFSAALAAGDVTRASYPFSFEFTVTYVFGAASLRCEISLRNLDGRPIPWCPGLHPYFAVPWEDGARRDDYRIWLPATRAWRSGPDRKLADAGARPIFPTRLNEPGLRATFFAGLRSREIVLARPDSTERVRLLHGTAATPDKAACIVLWTEDNDAPFFCVEPFMGPPNATATKLGLRWVDPLETDTFVIELRID